MLHCAHGTFSWSSCLALTTQLTFSLINLCICVVTHYLPPITFTFTIPASTNHRRHQFSSLSALFVHHPSLSFIGAECARSFEASAQGQARRVDWLRRVQQRGPSPQWTFCASPCAGDGKGKSLTSVFYIESGRNSLLLSCLYTYCSISHSPFLDPPIRIIIFVIIIIIISPATMLWSCVEWRRL